MSILSLNNSSIFKEIHDLIKNGSTEEDLDKLKRLWTLVGLDVDGCKWVFSEYNNRIIYTFTLSGCVMLESPRSGEEIELTNPSVFTTSRTSREGEIETSQRILVLLSSTKKFIIDKSFARSRHYLIKLK